MLGHKIYIYHIALSSGGQRIASASRDCTVGIWDLSTRRQIGDPLQAQNGLHSVAWSPDGLSIVAGDVEGTIYLWTVPPLQDSISAPILNTSSPPLPSTSRSRANSGSSSILNLPAGPSVAQPQSPELNNSPGEEDNWENSTNESFDSVLDLPADGKHPAQRRKRRRRRVAPAASTSSPPISTVPNASLGYNHIAPPSMLKPQQHQAPHVIISAPHHSPPLDQTPRPPVQTTPRAHVEADASASHVGALSRLWGPKRILSRRNGRKDRNHLDEPHENPPTASRFGSIPRLWGRASNVTGGTNSESRTSHDDAHEMQSAPSHPISTLPANVPDMQLPPKPPRTPTSRAVKVSSAYGFNRTHAATSDEDDEVPCRDYICFCMCCPCKGSLKPDSDLESDTGS
ncbi:hypothetical protein BJ138DRAFT_1165284 [Hygrophoropsis aurantiaca]|uniref:Uncharacterized protein n=1 Tax=Hygrophoropsis aurantiaca TaxID=72124 RepID=A0ACB7ZVP9_9AGAM|nr:hypothetical protein BJ138DRAFT_1165284 [Hygrophoropsis aurantiaca]